MATLMDAISHSPGGSLSDFLIREEAYQLGSSPYLSEISHQRANGAHLATENLSNDASKSSGAYSLQQKTYEKTRHLLFSSITDITLKILW
jgi:hypothetical protein